MKKILAVAMAAVCTVMVAGCSSVSRTDYDTLSANYEALYKRYDELKEKNDELTIQIEDLKTELASYKGPKEEPSDLEGQKSSSEPPQKEGFESFYVTEGELYDAITAVAPSVELKDVTKISTGIRTLYITVHTDQETLVKNTDEFVSNMKAIRDQCQTAIIDNGYKSVYFHHIILSDENSNNILFIFNKQGSNLVLEDNDQWKLTAMTHPEYTEALMTSLNDWVSD